MSADKTTTEGWWPSTREEWIYWQDLVVHEHAVQQKKIEKLRLALRALAQSVVDSVSSCDGVVSIEAEHQARFALEEILA